MGASEIRNPKASLHKYLSIYIYFLRIWRWFTALKRYLSMYIAYISVSKPIPWAVAGTHGQLASILFLSHIIAVLYFIDSQVIATCTMVIKPFRNSHVHPLILSLTIHFIMLKQHAQQYTFLYGRRHAKRSLMSWVVVIPKEDRNQISSKNIDPLHYVSPNLYLLTLGAFSHRWETPSLTLLGLIWTPFVNGKDHGHLWVKCNLYTLKVGWPKIFGIHIWYTCTLTYFTSVKATEK